MLDTATRHDFKKVFDYVLSHAPEGTTKYEISQRLGVTGNYMRYEQGDFTMRESGWVEFIKKAKQAVSEFEYLEKYGRPMYSITLKQFAGVAIACQLAITKNGDDGLRIFLIDPENKEFKLGLNKLFWSSDLVNKGQPSLFAVKQTLMLAINRIRRTNPSSKKLMKAIKVIDANKDQFRLEAE